MSEQPVSYPQAVLSTPSLLHYWRLGDESGPYADSVGSLPIPVHGSPPPIRVPGLVADDDGAIRITTSRPQTWPTPMALLSTWSVAFLFRAPGSGAVSVLMQMVAPLNALLVQATLNPTNLQLGHNLGGASPYINGPFSADRETHLAVVTWNGSELRLYVDHQTTSVVPTNPASGVNQLSLGANTSGGGSFTDGVIDEAAVFSTGLDAEQVARLYQAIPIPQLPGPLPSVQATAGYSTALVEWQAPPEGGPVEEYVIEWEEFGDA